MIPWCSIIHYRDLTVKIRAKLADTGDEEDQEDRHGMSALDAMYRSIALARIQMKISVGIPGVGVGCEAILPCNLYILTPLPPPFH